METEATSAPQPSLSDAKTTFGKEEILSFYKQSLPRILKTVFVNPVDGIYELLSATKENSFFNAVIIMATTAILYMLLPYLMMGDYKERMGGFGTTFKLGLITLLLMAIIGLAAFAVKAIKGKPNFKNELLTGALCGIPLTLILVLAFVVQLFAKDMDITSIAMDPLRGMQSAGMIIGLVTLYSFLMLINIFQQSLRSAAVSTTLGWYLSPLAIMLSFYLASKLGAAFF